MGNRMIEQLCSKCEALMLDVWKAETDSGRPELQGWYCSSCHHWQPNDLKVIEFHWDEYGRPHRLNGK